MKQFMISILTLLLTSVLVSNANAVSGYSEDQYEQAVENYIENLHSGNFGVITATLVEMVAITEETDQYDLEMAVELQDFVRENESEKLSQKAYLVLVALNNRSILEELDMNTSIHEDFFVVLSETVDMQLFEDSELTTEAQLEE